MADSKVSGQMAVSNHSSEREKGRNLSSLTRLFGFFKPYKLELAFAAFVLIITAGISLTFPIAIRRVGDGFYSGSSEFMDYYFTAAVWLASLLALGTALRFYLVNQL